MVDTESTLCRLLGIELNQLTNRVLEPDAIRRTDTLTEREIRGMLEPHKNNPEQLVTERMKLLVRVGFSDRPFRIVVDSRRNQEACQFKPA